MDEEYALYEMIERIAPKIIAEERKIYKGVCINIDYYSGLLYKMLKIICNCTSSRLERTPYGRACKFLQDHPSCLHQHCRDQRVRSY